MSSNQLIHLKNTSNTELLRLIEGDITFSVLYRILKGDCTDIFHNNESVIVCYSNSPYPIWVWCKDTSNKADIASIAACIKANYPLEDGYNIIMRHDVLEALKRYDGYFENVDFKMELLSYQLNELKQISYSCNGRAEKLTADDIETVAYLVKDMSYEMEGFVFELDECREKARKQIDLGQLYAWKNSDGEIVALSAKKIDGKFGSVSMVYTVPVHRRRGYAINLVYTITREILAEGATPILYTDGAYVASNDCYKKIGFEQVGRICNIERKK